MDKKRLVELVEYTRNLYEAGYSSAEIADILDALFKLCPSKIIRKKRAKGYITYENVKIPRGVKIPKRMNQPTFKKLSAIGRLLDEYRMISFDDIERELNISHGYAHKLFYFAALRLPNCRIMREGKRMYLVRE